MQTNATFLKLAGPQLVQMFIGDGAKMVRDAFALAKEKAPCIIFIDEVRGCRPLSRARGVGPEVWGRRCGATQRALCTWKMARQMMDDNTTAERERPTLRLD